jgi:fructokinase
MTETNTQNGPEVLVIGEVLFDIFPEYRRLGGAPFNFAVHLHKLGFSTGFISSIGEDKNGRQIIEFMDNIGLSHHYVQRDDTHPTGYVSVNLDNQGVPKFDIHQNVAYDNLNYTDDIGKLLTQPVKLIYFGTLIQRTRKGFETVQQILDNRHPDTQTFCDLNFRPDCYNREVVLASLQQADILKLNHEELQEVGQFIDAKANTKAIITHLMREYQIKTITITHGAEGSEWFSTHLHSQSDSPKVDHMVDTVGAGDAFAAAAATGCLQHWPIDQTLNAASQFAARICGTKGALPSDDQLYEEFKRNTPFQKG